MSIELPVDRPATAGAPSSPAVASRPLSVTPPPDRVALAAWAVVAATYSQRTRLDLGVVTDRGPSTIDVDVAPTSSFTTLMTDLAGVEPTPTDWVDLPAGFVLIDFDPHDGTWPDIPLWIGLDRSGAEPLLAARYDRARFDEPTAHRILGHVDHVMAQVAADGPGVAIDEITVTTPDEIAWIGRWNSTEVDWEDGTLVSLFAGAVERWPEATALVDGDRALTYAELAETAGRVAARLHAEGVERGSKVGVLAERSVEMVASLYGVLMAGAAYVPLDPEYPADRLGYMIDETGMRVVLGQQRFRHLLAGTAVTFIDAAGVVEGEGAALDLASAATSVAPDDLAYVIYTSGSTGRPKGVANAHRGVVNRMRWGQDYFELGPGNRLLQKTPYSFDVSVWELFGPHETGACLVVARPGGHRDPAYLVEVVNQQRIDTIHFVPSMLRLFLDHPAAGSCASLERFVLTGEAVTKDLQDRFFEVFPHAELHNLYGPTEAAIEVTAWQCRPDDGLPIVPIGRPIANTTIHVLDEAMRRVPVGIPAELYIGGVQVAVGYLERPELTAERFVPDPFSPGGRLYKTGDLARWLPDGTIDFLGRLDHQIKLRGQRVELGEIEAVLGEHPSVLEATVTVQHTTGDATLVAHVMWRDVPASDASLRAFLARWLPAYMIPSRFVSHDALPLTTSGKVDRNALTALADETRVRGSSEEGADSLEDFLLGVWRSVLGRPDVGPHDRVFDLGATSLQAAVFVNEVQRELDELIYVMTVFTAPTVAEYAEFLTRTYPDTVERHFGRTTDEAAAEDRPVDEELVERMGSLVPRPGPYPGWSTPPPNPRAAFILAPPRSGTTLLRVMLAGHSRLFAASELQLLGFDTLADRRQRLSGRFAHWREGAVRAVMALEGCDAADATAFVEHHEARGLTCKEFFGVLQERTGGQLLIDKTPAYAFDLEVLRNAEAGFDRPLYIHLVRDPVAMSRSFESYHMDQVLYLEDHDIPARTLGELIWTMSHRTILGFGEEIDAERMIRIRFEDLLEDPRSVMDKLAGFLGVDFEESLVDPYGGIDQKMVDGLHAASTPMGDMRLLERDRIDPSVANRWSGSLDELGEPTRRLARDLGYGHDEPAQPGQTDRRRSYAADARRRRGRRER